MGRTRPAHRRALHWLTGAVVIALLGVAPPSAQAVGTGSPLITSPWDMSSGQSYERGFAPSLRIDFSDAPAGDYAITVDCTGDGHDYTWNGSYSYDGAPESDLGAWELPAISPESATVCTAEVHDASLGSTDEVEFLVEGIPLDLSGVALSRERFFPRVADGYRDTTVLEYHLNRTAATRIRVRDDAGRLVRSVDEGDVSDWNQWTWNGRDDAGRRVAPGDYRVKVSAITEDDQSASVTRRVEVATGFRVLHESVRRGPLSTTSRRGTGTCSTTRFFDDLFLDCWGGGGFARATYAFRVPATAFRLSWRVSGEQGCCASPGRIRKSGARTSRTRYVVTIKVNGWRSYYVRGVRLAYDYKERI